MKKLYIAPCMMQMHINVTRHLLEGSFETPTTGGGSVYDEPGHTPGGALTRHSKVWGDDDDWEDFGF